MFSAVPPTTDIAKILRHVRFVPFAIFCTAEYSTLFNRVVGDGTAVLIRVQSPRYRQVRRSTLPRRSSIMDIDRDHIDDAVLALLFLGRHDGMRTLEILRLGRDGAAPYKGIDLGASRQN